MESQLNPPEGRKTGPPAMKYNRERRSSRKTEETHAQLITQRRRSRKESSQAERTENRPMQHVAKLRADCLSCLCIFASLREILPSPISVFGGSFCCVGCSAGVLPDGYLAGLGDGPGDAAPRRQDAGSDRQGAGYRPGRRPAAVGPRRRAVADPARGASRAHERRRALHAADARRDDQANSWRNCRRGSRNSPPRTT